MEEEKKRTGIGQKIVKLIACPDSWTTILNYVDTKRTIKIQRNITRAICKTKKKYMTS